MGPFPVDGHIYNTVVRWFMQFLSRCVLSHVPIVSSVIHLSSLLAYNFLRYNNIYGNYHVKPLFHISWTKLWTLLPLLRTTFMNCHAHSHNIISLSFSFILYSCGCLGQWSVQEPLSSRLATGYSPVGHWSPLSM